MKDFTKRIKIRAEARDIFNAITNPFAIELWSGYPATIKPEEGSEFELWDGDICGKILEIETNKRIVQEWYFGEQSVESIVTIKIEDTGAYSDIKLSHTNIPDEVYENIIDGWNNQFWGAIKDFFK